MKYGYMRVSTKKQETDMQLTALRDKGCDEIIEDKGVSGMTTSRPGLDELLLKLKEGDVLVVWKMDRLGRGFTHLLGMIDDLMNRGVGFISTTESFDTTTIQGRAMMRLLATFAEMEREIITERVRAGVAEYKKEHGTWGRYKRVAKNHKEEILKMVADGKKQDEIANRLGFSQAAISRFLSQQKRNP